MARASGCAISARVRQGRRGEGREGAERGDGKCERPRGKGKRKHFVLGPPCLVGIKAGAAKAMLPRCHPSIIINIINSRFVVYHQSSSIPIDATAFLRLQRPATGIIVALASDH